MRLLVLPLMRLRIEVSSAAGKEVLVDVIVVVWWTTVRYFVESCPPYLVLIPMQRVIAKNLKGSAARAVARERQPWGNLGQGARGKGLAIRKSR
jgi:hypothetical protein